MRSIISKILLFTFLLNLIAIPVQASGGAGGIASIDTTGLGSGNEFVSGNFPGAILMPVNLWGAVARPGIHHIPTQTDLITLLSLAGGPGPDAVLDQIIIKRRSGPEEKVIKINGDEFLNQAGIHSPVLEANDIVVIPRERPPISNNTLTTVSFLGTVLSLVLTGYAVSKLGGK